MKISSLAVLISASLAVSTGVAHADELSANAILGATPFAHNTYGVNTVRGRAQLEPNDEDGTLKVVVKISGLTPGTTHIGHIHNGTCASLFPGAIIQNLEPIVIDEDGEGKSTTNISASLTGLRDCDWWVAVHEGAANASPQTPAVAVGPVITERDD